MKSRQTGRSSAIAELMVKHIINSSDKHFAIISPTTAASEHIREKILSFVYNYDGMFRVMRNRIETNNRVTVRFFSAQNLQYHGLVGLQFDDIYFDDASFLLLSEEQIFQIISRIRR